jgi:hypothetical protein
VVSEAAGDDVVANLGGGAGGPRAGSRRLALLADREVGPAGDLAQLGVVLGHGKRLVGHLLAQLDRPLGVRLQPQVVRLLGRRGDLQGGRRLELVSHYGESVGGEGGGDGMLANLPGGAAGLVPALLA